MIIIRDVREFICIRIRRTMPRRRVLGALVIVFTLITASSIAIAGDLDKVILFDIEAQTLDKALLQFGAQAHVQISIEWTPSLHKVRTKKLEGKYTVQNGLTKLLNGSGLAFSARGNTVQIVPSSSAVTQIPSRPTERADPLNKEAGLSHSSVNQTVLPSQQGKKSPVGPNIETLQEVTVTGTHISGVVPAYPVTTITRTQILQSGLPTVDDVLRTSPEVFSGGASPGAIQVGQGTFNSGDPGTGSASVNLLGIGNDSTLTLIDGLRLSGTGDLSSGDLSLIPAVAVERIDIQTGGSSAIYGSDAVAGVVNVVLRRDYNGEETSGYVGWTQEGGDFTQRYSQLIGRTFDQGSLLLAAEFDQGDALRADQRAISSTAGSSQYLQPSQKSESVLLNLHYALSDTLQTHAVSLYTHRTAFYSEPGEAYPSDIDEFDSDGGITYQLDNDSSIGVDVTDAGYNQVRYISYTPCPCSPSIEAIQNGLFGVDLHGSGRMATLPTGNLSVAVGAGFRRENLDVEGDLGPAQSGSRRIADAYLESSLPLIKESISRTGAEALSLDGAVRYSSYSDFGSTTNPMAGVVYTPLRPVMLKATYATSFLAPTLFELYEPENVSLYPGSIFPGAPAASTVLYVAGGNERLKPETAHSLTMSIQFSPRFRDLPGALQSSATYYDIHYNSRISNPILNPADALVTPLVQSFVTRNPTITQQNGVIAGAGGLGELYNPFGLPYAPGSVTALLDDGFQNMSGDVIHGATAGLDYTWSSTLGRFTASWAGTWLRFDQRLLPGSAPEMISGTVFNPPDFKMRGSFAWQRGAWSAIVFVNHISDEQLLFPGTAEAPATIGAWTTMDGQVGYVLGNLGTKLERINVTLSITNLLGTAPPVVPEVGFVGAPVGFDTSNASALGRAFAICVTVEW